MAQCYDKTWATLAQNKMCLYCLLLVVVVLGIGDYKVHYCYNIITHSGTKLYGTINIKWAQLYVSIV